MLCENLLLGWSRKLSRRNSSSSLLIYFQSYTLVNIVENLLTAFPSDQILWIIDSEEVLMLVNNNVFVVNK